MSFLWMEKARKKNQLSSGAKSKDVSVVIPSTYLAWGRASSPEIIQVFFIATPHETQGQLPQHYCKKNSRKVGMSFKNLCSPTLPHHPMNGTLFLAPRGLNWGLTCFPELGFRGCRRRTRMHLPL